MTCWNGHMPHMNNDQMHQAVHAYYAAYERSWRQAWQSPVNPLRDVGDESPERQEPRRTTSLPEAKAGDKVDAIDVEYVQVH